MSSCPHDYLQFNVVDSGQFSYRPPAERVVQEALQTVEPAPKKHKSGNGEASEPLQIRLPPASTFPAPCVVPDDLLFTEDREGTQTLGSWDRIRKYMFTAQRKTVYFAHLPLVAEGLESLGLSRLVDRTKGKRPESVPARRNPARAGRADVKPVPADEAKAASVEQPSTEPPRAEEVLEYLQAFYHGFPVKFLENAHELAFAKWDDDTPATTKTSGKKKTSPMPPYVGLSTGKELIRIRCRPSPDRVFKAQLNLNDLLDVAIAILPKDAYALLLSIDDDLYEDETDDFCCGRAYGGSRVAIVSTARYNPDIDKKQKLNMEHSWPASHCCRWVARQYSNKALALSRMTTTETLATQDPVSAVAAAILASNALPVPSDAQQRAALWLGRVCKTASHELGHCFGIGHCSYYACIMQGTANIVEDSRQPPYLCPVDLAKILRATGSGEKERYQALLEFCGKWKGDRMFAAFGAWLEVRMQQPDVITL